MELPDDILRHIKAYAMPVTNAYWKHLHKMTTDAFYSDIAKVLSAEDREYHSVGIIRIRNIYLQLLYTGGFEVIHLFRV